MDRVVLYRHRPGWNLAAAACLIAGLLCIAGCAKPTHGGRVLFVVPQALPDGRPAAVQQAAFESWLVENAGGFTRLDQAEGAWMGPDRRIVREKNHLYLVTFPAGRRGFEAELDRRIREDFQQQESWVQKW